MHNRTSVPQRTEGPHRFACYLLRAPVKLVLASLAARIGPAPVRTQSGATMPTTPSYGTRWSYWPGPGSICRSPTGISCTTSGHTRTAGETATARVIVSTRDRVDLTWTGFGLTGCSEGSVFDSSPTRPRFYGRMTMVDEYSYDGVQAPWAEAGGGLILTLTRADR